MTTFNTPNKGVARQRQADFYSRNIRNLGKSPEELRAFLLPYTSETEALEVTDVLDTIEIPRSNITGAEYNEERQEGLESQNLGIEIEKRDAGDYFAETESIFDIVSLDFDGNLSDDKLDILRTIAARQLLSPHALLSVNVYAIREQFIVKANYNGGNLDETMFVAWLKIRSPEKAPGYSMLSLLHDRDIRELYLEFVRDVGTTKTILEIMAQGKDSLFVPDLFRKSPEYNSVNDYYRNKHKNRFFGGLKNTIYLNSLVAKAANNNIFYIEDGRKRYVKPSADDMKNREYSRFIGELEQHLNDDQLVVIDPEDFHDIHSSDIMVQMRRQGIDPEKYLPILLARDSRGYHPFYTERISYDTQRPGTMLMDMYVLDQLEADFHLYDAIRVEQSGGALTFEIPDHFIKHPTLLDRTMHYITRQKERSQFPEFTPRTKI